MGHAALRTIGVVTTARSDYGIYVPVLREIERRKDLRLALIVGGMHLSPEFGNSVEQIERDGFAIADRVEMLVSSDTPLGTAKSIGLGVIGFAESFARLKPDLLLVLGDRFEMHSAALAALPLQLPLAHIHGGEVTDGAIDDALRHGTSKIAHLHFVATSDYKARLERLGEEPWRITISGAPSLDNLSDMKLLEPAALYESLNLPLLQRPLLATYHPVTREVSRAKPQVAALLQALDEFDGDIVFTMPNADPAGRAIAEEIRAFAATRPRVHLVDNLGTQRYFSMMHVARAMIGNSSSGIIEAASFALPVVNIGNRQAGRTRGHNVIDVADGEDSTAIARALFRATDPAFAATLEGMANVYGSGAASRAIVDRLANEPIDARLLAKRFHDA